MQTVAYLKDNLGIEKPPSCPCIISNGTGYVLATCFSQVIQCPLSCQANILFPICYLCKKLKTIPLRKKNKNMTTLFPLLNWFPGKNTLNLTPISTGLVILSAFPDVPGEWGDVMMGDICPNAARSTSESAKGIWGDPGGRPWTVRAT